MIIENNPATKQQHNNWQLRIKAEFPNTDFSFSSDYLCLIHYLDKAPQKFYSKDAFKQYLTFLEKAKIMDPKLLSDILIEAEPLLSISNRILTEVNDKPIHDTFLPKEQNDLINFIDKDIHYNLLKIYETPFFHLSKIVAKYHWIKDNKSTEGLDLYNSVEQLKKVDFGFVERYYLHDVRNGIAHGKIVFTDMDITYIDKKGGKTKIPTRNIIDTLDGILDITNGFCLAFKIFALTNSDFFESYKIQIPQSILLEELQAKANGPAWTITNCLESVAMHDKKQLMIYVKNDNWDYNKVNWYSFTTALWAEALTKSYERIFFSLNSTHNRISPTGWAAYDATMFKRLREIDEKRFEAFIGVLENDYVYFIPKIKFPKFIYKIGTFISVIKITLPLEWRKYVDTYFPNPFFIRETQIHSKKSFSVVQDPSVIIKPNFQNDIEGLIRENKKRIVKLAISYSRKQCSRFSITRYLPVKYARVFIYDTDKRVRNLRYSVLIPDLIATIEINTTKHIKTIDILSGTPEQIGKYRIVWNKSWQEKKKTLAKL
jgi:hypothetical protein